MTYMTTNTNTTAKLTKTHRGRFDVRANGQRIGWTVRKASDAWAAVLLTPGTPTGEVIAIEESPEAAADVLAQAHEAFHG